ncbi:MAG: stage IV sporulation protein A [Firmicutes bacterium]|nr:stage IV sporulation protein A [Bacillota bacterium]
MCDIYRQIAERTGGEIHLGIIGPVRSGKSTFIRRFMELMVVPGLESDYERRRLIDELPQSGEGRTVMTAEPKFVPAEAATLALDDNMKMKVRMVDCVGYMVPGALGVMEEGRARMVATPWTQEKIPFSDAAEIGTEKVIKEHSTIGVVVTSDGSIGEIEREAYEPAEERVIKELREIGKPFVVIMNSVNPEGEECRMAAEALSSAHNVPVIPLNCERMKEDDIAEVLREALYQFPVSQVNFYLPGFTEGLSEEHWIKSTIIDALTDWASGISTLSDMKAGISGISDGEIVESVTLDSIDPATGTASVTLAMNQGLFYRVVSELMEEDVRNDAQFFSLIREFAKAKKEYDKLELAMEEVGSSGYGIVKPRLSEMVLEEPEVYRQGNKFGVRLKAKAPSMHIIKTDITTEVSPVIGTEKQSEDLVKSLKEEMNSNPEAIWNTNFFGKTLHEMDEEQMASKLTGVPDGVRSKVQKSLQKISDEGKDYFICIIL